MRVLFVLDVLIDLIRVQPAGTLAVWLPAGLTEVYDPINKSPVVMLVGAVIVKEPPLVDEFELFVSITGTAIY